MFCECLGQINLDILSMYSKNYSDWLPWLLFYPTARLICACVTINYFEAPVAITFGTTVLKL
jgi:hypothetical protein